MPLLARFFLNIDLRIPYNFYDGQIDGVSIILPMPVNSTVKIMHAQVHIVA